MPKVIIEYDLDNFDDERAHLRAIKSENMACLLFEIKNNMFRRFEEGEIHLDEIFEEMDKLFNDFKINLDELIV
jgi:hypothetical protein